MKKMLKLVIVFTFIFGGLLAGFANAKSSLSTANGFSAAENSALAANAKIYASNCARCHGADGKGQTVVGQSLDTPDLTAQSLSAASVARIVSKGKGSMPSFGKKLTKAQIASVAAYAARLK